MLDNIINPIRNFFYEEEPIFIDKDEDYINRFMQEDIVVQNNENKSFFKHLEENDISYKHHFYNSMGYCLMSLKSSFYFFIHAFLPNTFEYDGSHEILDLHKKLVMNSRRMTH